MNIKRIATLTILLLFTASITNAEVIIHSGPQVVLDAENLKEGPLETWADTRGLNMTFHNDGTNPQVKVIDGIKAVIFSGKDHMTSDFTAPARITGDQGWTCVVRAYSTEVSGERTIFSWANRPLNCLEIEYGDAVLYGAIGTWNDPHTLGWGGNVPKPGQWHTLIYSYDGGPNGVMQAWCDGELRTSKVGTLATKKGKTFVIVPVCRRLNQIDMITSINLPAPFRRYLFIIAPSRRWKSGTQADSNLLTR